MTIIKPMLAAKLEWDRVKYPVFVSPKIDGIRCVVEDGIGWSRSHKPLPNHHLQENLKHFGAVLNWFDGEVVVGEPSGPEVMNRTTSGVMSQDGLPIFRYMVFDYLENERDSYIKRLTCLREKKPLLPPWCQVVPQTLCHDRQQVEEIEAKAHEDGYEGVIVRDPRAPYKQGRSTATQGWLLKLKRYEDAEAVIIGFEELMHNENEAFTNVQGHTSRTSHKAGQRAGNVLGALTCRLVSDPSVVFSIGTGFDFQQRETFWYDRAALMGKIVKFKYMPYGMLGSTGVPRFPVFLSFRDEIDM